MRSQEAGQTARARFPASVFVGRAVAGLFVSGIRRRRLYQKWLEADKAGDGSGSGESFGSNKDGKSMASEAHNSRSPKRPQHSRGSGYRAKKAARAAAHRERTTGDTTSPAEFRLQRAERVTGLRGTMASTMMDFWIKNLPSGAGNIADLDLLASRLMPQQIEGGHALLRQINPRPS